MFVEGVLHNNSCWCAEVGCSVPSSQDSSSIHHYYDEVGCALNTCAAARVQCNRWHGRPDWPLLYTRAFIVQYSSLSALQRARDNISAYQASTAAAEKQQREAARVPVREALKTELQALYDAASCGWKELIKHCYDKHPPRNPANR